MGFRSVLSIVSLAVAGWLVSSPAAHALCPTLTQLPTSARLTASTSKGQVTVSLTLGAGDAPAELLINVAGAGGTSILTEQISPGSKLVQSAAFADSGHLLSEVRVYRRNATLSDLVFRYRGPTANDSFATHLSITDYVSGEQPRLSMLCISESSPVFVYPTWLATLENALGAAGLHSTSEPQRSNACEFATPGCVAPVFVEQSVVIVPPLPTQGTPPVTSNPSNPTPPADPRLTVLRLMGENNLLMRSALKARKAKAKQALLRQISAHMRDLVSTHRSILSAREHRILTKAIRAAKKGLGKRRSARQVQTCLKAVRKLLLTL